MKVNRNWIRYTYEIVPTYWLDPCMAFDWKLVEEFTCIVTYRRGTKNGHWGICRHKFYKNISRESADILINLNPVVRENILQIWITSMLSEWLKVKTYNHKIIGEAKTEHVENLSTACTLVSLEKIIEVALENDNKTQ